MFYRNGEIAGGYEVDWSRVDPEYKNWVPAGAVAVHGPDGVYPEGQPGEGAPVGFFARDVREGEEADILIHGDIHIPHLPFGIYEATRTALMGPFTFHETLLEEG
jgi:hypothetical protein